LVSERKKQEVKNLEGELKKYPVIGLLDMFKLPARQLQEIRNRLRGKAVIKMVRKNVIKFAIENVKRKGLRDIEGLIQNQPALLFSNKDPFELARIIESSRSSALAKEGDTAPKDIVVKAGPTSLKPGPVIGELQRVKIPAGVEGEKIVIKEDTILVKEGEKITKPVADVLAKLGIEPMDIGLNLVCAWEQGVLYKKDVLFRPLEEYVKDIENCHKNAFNLALNINYMTRETVRLFLSKGYQEAMNLALNANIITRETVRNLFAKANAQMLILKERLSKDTETVEKEVQEKQKNKSGDTKIHKEKLVEKKEVENKTKEL
jgi:large subunit ribosomal protein L10